MKSARTKTFLLGLKNARGINLHLRTCYMVISLLLKMILLKKLNTFIKERLKIWRVLTRLRIRDNIIAKGDANMKHNMKFYTYTTDPSHWNDTEYFNSIEECLNAARVDLDEDDFEDDEHKVYIGEIHEYYPHIWASEVTRAMTAYLECNCNVEEVGMIYEERFSDEDMKDLEEYINLAVYHWASKRGIDLVQTGIEIVGEYIVDV